MPNLNSCYWVNCPFKEIEWKWKGKKTQSFVAIDWLSAWDNLIDICGRSLMIHSSTAEHKLMWKVFTASTWISLFTNIQVINVWLRFTIHWWVCFPIFMTYGGCFIVILYCWKKMRFFLSISILSILYTYSEFLVMSSDYITWISPLIGLYWLVVRCRWNINVHLTLCPLIRNIVCNNIN